MHSTVKRGWGFHYWDIEVTHWQHMGSQLEVLHGLDSSYDDFNYISVHTRRQAEVGGKPQQTISCLSSHSESSPVSLLGMPRRSAAIAMPVGTLSAGLVGSSNVFWAVKFSGEHVDYGNHRFSTSIRLTVNCDVLANHSCTKRKYAYPKKTELNTEFSRCL